MPTSERTLALRAKRAGPLTDDLLLELKRIAAALEAIEARLVGVKNGTPFVHGETRLTGDDRRRLRAILPVLHRQQAGGTFLAGAVVANSGRLRAAGGAHLATVLAGLTALRLGILLGRAADATTDDGVVEGYRVFRSGMMQRSQRWLIESA